MALKNPQQLQLSNQIPKSITRIVQYSYNQLQRRQTLRRLATTNSLDFQHGIKSKGDPF